MHISIQLAIQTCKKLANKIIAVHFFTIENLLGIPDTSFKGRRTLIALKALRDPASTTFNSFILRTLRREYKLSRVTENSDYQ